MISLRNDLPLTAQNRKALIVDDNPCDVFLMRHALLATGVVDQVESLSDAASLADHVASTGAPELLVLDYLLPGGTGLDALAQLRQNNKIDETRTVMLSGLIPPAAESSADESVLWLEKPGTLDGWWDLANSINALLSTAQARVRAVA